MFLLHELMKTNKSIYEYSSNVNGAMRKQAFVWSSWPYWQIHAKSATALLDPNIPQFV